MPEQKIFSETEAAKIIERASHIQERMENTVDTAPGITLEELRKIALECGLTPEAFERALIEPEDKTKTSFLNLVEETERVFDGEIDTDSLGELLDELSRNARFVTQASVGKMQRFQVSKGLVFGQLGISSRKGRTKITFKQTPFYAYFIGLHMPLILSIALGASLFAKGNTSIGLATILGLLSFGVFAFSMLAKTGKKKAREFVDDISEKVSHFLTDKSNRKNL
jgi:hypothetical protein